MSCHLGLVLKVGLFASLPIGVGAITSWKCSGMKIRCGANLVTTQSSADDKLN